ncbi:MAG: tetratricopeptide repeat protein [Anaerolineae bacterium]|nr:tetratricopeptide repeat protein [Phycisphaerae bacterium]
MSIDHLIQQAIAHHRGGRYADAEALLRQALAFDQNNPDALYLLGMLAIQTKRPRDAIEWLSRAVQVRPEAAEYHANLGHALRSLNRLDESATQYDRAIQIQPSYALAHINLGAIRRVQGRPRDAVEHFRTALRIEPRQIGGWMNLGNALRDLNELGDALDAYQKASALDPKLADARGAAATTLAALGRVSEAQLNFTAALRLAPNHLPTLVNFGMMLRGQNDFDGAIDCFRKALALDPGNGEAHERLGRALMAACRIDEATTHYEQAVRLSPTPRMRVTFATLIPPVYRSMEDVNFWRARLVEEIGKLQREGVKCDITSQPAPTIVYLPYQDEGGHDRELAEAIARLHMINQAPLPGPPPEYEGREQERKIRVGFLSGLFKNQTVGLWMQGLIAKLDRARFEVVAISTAPHNDETGRFIREHADRYVVLSPALPQARETIAPLGLDVLIFADIGMEPFTATLAHSRFAPVQCVMWGHPITSGMATVDYYISNEFADAEDGRQNYTENLARLPNLAVYYYRPAAPSRTFTRHKFELPDDAHLYGCLQAQYKLHPAFDAAIAGILRGDPKGLLLLTRGGTARGEDLILSRIRAGYPDIVDRVRFMPSLSRDEFRGLTALCDCLLAPFPFGAGDSSLEGFALNLPTVTLPTGYLKGRLTYAMYKLMQIDDCIARDLNEYVGIANRLGTDVEFNRAVRAKIAAANNVLYENEAGVRDVEEFLRQAVRSATA